MLKIRLARAGAKKKPFFHITVADSRMPRDGRFIERIGYFNPISRGKEVRLEVNQVRIDYWISKGAQVSERVLTLIKENNETPEKRIKREEKKGKRRLQKIAKRAEMKSEEVPVEEAKSAEAKAEEAPAVEKTSAAEAKAEEAPAVEETSAAEAKAEEAPAEEEKKASTDSEEKPEN